MGLSTLAICLWGICNDAFSLIDSPFNRLLKDSEILRCMHGRCTIVLLALLGSSGAVLRPADAVSSVTASLFHTVLLRLRRLGGCCYCGGRSFHRLF